MTLQIGDTIISKNGQQRFYRVVKMWPATVDQTLWVVEVLHVRQDGVSTGRNIPLAYRMDDEAPIGYYRRLRRGESHAEYATVKLVKGDWAVEAA